MKVMTWDALFFISCSNVSGQWWLSNIDSRGADEEFFLSSLTQGYGSILLSTRFLFTTNSFVSLPHLNLISNFARCHPSQLAGDHSPVFLCCRFVHHFCSSLCSTTSSPYLSPSGPANIELPLLTIVLSHTVFSLSHNLHLNETQWEKLLVLISQPHADEENPSSPVSVP